MSALRFERELDCDVATAWRAWTDPAFYAKWFNGTPGVDAVVHEMDVRVGGAVRFDMLGPDGEVYPNSGTFAVVDAPHRLVTTETFEGQEIRMEVTLSEGEEGTLMVIEQHGLPEELHDPATAGWMVILHRLDLQLAANET